MNRVLLFLLLALFGSFAFAQYPPDPPGYDVAGGYPDEPPGSLNIQNDMVTVFWMDDQAHVDYMCSTTAGLYPPYKSDSTTATYDQRVYGYSRGCGALIQNQNCGALGPCSGKKVLRTQQGIYRKTLGTDANGNPYPPNLVNTTDTTAAGSAVFYASDSLATCSARTALDDQSWAKTMPTPGALPSLVCDRGCEYSVTGSISEIAAYPETGQAVYLIYDATLTPNGQACSFSTGNPQPVTAEPVDGQKCMTFDDGTTYCYDDSGTTPTQPGICTIENGVRTCSGDPGTGDPGDGDPGDGDPGTGDPGTGDPGDGTGDGSGVDLSGVEEGLEGIQTTLDGIEGGVQGVETAVGGVQGALDALGDWLAGDAPAEEACTDPDPAMCGEGVSDAIQELADQEPIPTLVLPASSCPAFSETVDMFGETFVLDMALPCDLLDPWMGLFAVLIQISWLVMAFYIVLSA